MYVAFSLFRQVEVGCQGTLFDTTWPSTLSSHALKLSENYHISSKLDSMSQVRTRFHTRSREERVLEAESSNGRFIFLLHCGPQSDLQVISDEGKGPPHIKAHHTNESQYESTAGQQSYHCSH